MVAREIGQGYLESVVLGNLGMTYDALQLREPARRNYETALVVARRLEDRRTQGQVLGYFGLLQAREGEFDGARASFEEGERLLRELSDPLSRGLLLCCRAEAEQLGGASAAAAVALDEARVIAAEIGTSADSELGLAVQRAAAALEAGMPA